MIEGKLQCSLIAYYFMVSYSAADVCCSVHIFLPWYVDSHFCAPFALVVCAKYGHISSKWDLRFCFALNIFNISLQHTCLKFDCVETTTSWLKLLTVHDQISLSRYKPKHLWIFRDLRHICQERHHFLFLATKYDNIVHVRQNNIIVYFSVIQLLSLQMFSPLIYYLYIYMMYSHLYPPSFFYMFKSGIL
jgi:hypothetical protein